MNLNKYSKTVLFQYHLYKVDDLLSFGTPQAAKAPPQAQKQDDDWGVFSDPNFGSEQGKVKSNPCSMA